MKAAPQYLYFFLIIVVALAGKAQSLETRYAMETTFDGKTPVAYEDNYGALKFNSLTGDLSFMTNLATLKTGDKKVDSLLKEREELFFSFQANLGQNRAAIVGEENDGQLHKLVGSVLVENVSYPVDAYVSIKNLSDISNGAKMLLDLTFEVNPKTIVIPYLSGYFKNIMVFQINDGIINQNN